MLIKPFTIVFIALLSALGGGGNTATVHESAPQIIHPNDPASVEQYVREAFPDAPVMNQVAWCESKFRQFEDDGSIHRGVVPSDVGVMQINEYYHGKTALRLGIDLHTLSGNVAYARYLLLKEGTRPWKSSSHCWSEGGESEHLALR